MQINGSFQIVTVVTSVVPAFFGCIALLFFHFVFRFLVLLYLLECAGEFRLCGGDHGLCPLDSHKPLKRLDRNFKCFGTDTFVSLIGFCAMLTTAAACYLPICGKLNAAAPQKNKTDTAFSAMSAFVLFIGLSEIFSVCFCFFFCFFSAVKLIKLFGCFC